MQHVSEALRAATRQLCRSLKDNPNVTDNMAKVATERQALQSLLNSCLANLQERQCIQPIIDVVMTTEQAEVSDRGCSVRHMMSDMVADRVLATEGC